MVTPLGSVSMFLGPLGLDSASSSRLHHEGEVSVMYIPEGRFRGPRECESPPAHQLGGRRGGRWGEGRRGEGRRGGRRGEGRRVLLGAVSQSRVTTGNSDGNVAVI